MIDLAHVLHRYDDIAGVVPWWHRVFYLHIAGTILIAAMLRNDQDDLSAAKVTQSWNKAISTLRAHEHLSPFVQQVVTNFEALASKISETHSSGGVIQPAETDRFPGTHFHDVFEDIGFDPENSLFGKEDMAWLSNFESFV